jgi:hypothetical protein
MAIKDLVVKSNEVGEEATEKIILPYVNYTDKGELIFNEAFYALSADEKISIALVAKEGWRYVPENEKLAGGMKNEEIEKVTFLPGNTVRPTVKKLRDESKIKTEKGVHSPTTKLIMSLLRKKQDIK